MSEARREEVAIIGAGNAGLTFGLALHGPIDAISWEVGYEDPAFFRRLFKRITRITPGDYRRRFRMPEFSVAEAS